MKKIVSVILALVMGASLLAGCGSASQGNANANAQAGGTVSAAADPGIPENTYIIYVKDAETGDPIEGAKVQLCTDTECWNGESDADGKAVFEADAGNYTVHLGKVPEGYEKSGEEFDLTAENRTAMYALKKAGEV